ncbi:MAG: DUF1194 domain-containing protein [Rhodobacter sp.]|nr:DUF1194 domain-containing protein [Paracoccaceae bacterium]MCC0076948.1 DUF1194 domain-containing protein [Rhodobacter sp.]
MLRRTALLCLWLTTLPHPALACRLALVLGFDVSLSVDAADYAAQRDGIVAALTDPRLRALLLDNPQPVAMAAFEWAGHREQALIADWTLLDSPAAIDRFAATIAAHPRRHRGLTAVGSALTYAVAQLERAPVCTRQTIDLAGDGVRNNGPQPRRIYDTSDLGGITVNGLAIGGLDPEVLQWFRDNVLHGPGAFVEFAASRADFAAAFRRKLIREVQEPLLGMAAAPHHG